MSTIQRLAARWLNQRRKAIAAESAVYRQDQLSILIRVTRGQRTEENASGGAGGFRERVVYQEFLVAAGELDAHRDTSYWTPRVWRRTEQPPQPIAPKSGDRIVIGDEIYELAPQNELPCVSNSDTFGTILRLRTHLIQEKA
jgi:hypothetical protein